MHKKCMSIHMAKFSLDVSFLNVGIFLTMGI